MTYRIVLARPAEKELVRVRDRKTRQRLMGAIDALARDPYPPGATKLRGSVDVWRIRAGRWRICYMVETDRLVVVILTVAQRGDVYERLRKMLG